VFHYGTQSTKFNRFQAASLLSVPICFARLAIPLYQNQPSIGDSLTRNTCQNHKTHGLHLIVRTAPRFLREQLDNHGNASAITKCATQKGEHLWLGLRVHGTIFEQHLPRSRIDIAIAHPLKQSFQCYQDHRLLW